MTLPVVLIPEAGADLRQARRSAATTGLAALMDDNDRVAAKKSAETRLPAPVFDDKDQLARVRIVCGAFPGIIEKISHGSPAFFTPKRIFVMFVNNHHNDGHLAIWIPAAPGVQKALIEEAPETYFRPPYVGISGWVGVELAKVDDDQLSALIREAFLFLGAKKAAPKSQKSRSGSRARARGN